MSPLTHQRFPSLRARIGVSRWDITPELDVCAKNWGAAKHAFDLGCGNGATVGMLHGQGFKATGVEISESGVAQARKSFPNCTFAIGNAYDDLAATYGTFDLVVSLEVIEHCMEPRRFAKTFMDLIVPGGIGFLSTPYHGYLKNIALAVSDKMDSHYTALWDGGHVKFFSIATLTALMQEAGAKDIQFLRVGRIPAFAKSMVCIVRKPL